MRGTTRNEVDWKHIGTLVIGWALVLWCAVAFFWQGSPEVFPFRGARGMLDGWISGPLFYFSLGYAVFLSIPRLYSSAILFVGAGAFLAIGACLAIYVPNGGFTVPWFVGLALLYEGYRLTHRSTGRGKQRRAG
jgi:hypothetical protein